MHGHMPPPPPGGGFPGGHHGGHHHGGRPAWGPGFKFWGPVSKAPGGDVASTGDYFSEKAAKTHVGFYCNSKIIKKNTGSGFKSFIGAYRMNMTGPLHSNVFASRVESIERDFSEHRITEEQAKYRKLKAAAKYYSYLLSVGIYTKLSFVFELQNYAEEIGALGENRYIFEQVVEENGIKYIEFYGSTEDAKIHRKILNYIAFANLCLISTCGFC